jgi:hypothetical protein
VRLFISSRYRDCYAPLPWAPVVAHLATDLSAVLQSRLSACRYCWCPQESYPDSFQYDPGIPSRSSLVKIESLATVRMNRLARRLEFRMW